MRAPAEKAEGGAVVMDVHEAQDPGNETHHVRAEEGIGDPELHSLVQDDDKDADD